MQLARLGDETRRGRGQRGRPEAAEAFQLRRRRRGRRGRGKIDRTREERGHDEQEGGRRELKKETEALLLRTVLGTVGSELRHVMNGGKKVRDSIRSYIAQRWKAWHGMAHGMGF